MQSISAHLSILYAHARFDSTRLDSTRLDVLLKVMSRFPFDEALRGGGGGGCRRAPSDGAVSDVQRSRAFAAAGSALSLK